MKMTSSISGILFAALMLFKPAWAVSTAANKLTITAGSSQAIAVSGVSGALSVTNSAPTVVIVSQSSAGSYKVAGITAGIANITFKDKKSSTTVAVTVTAAPSAVLQGRLLASNCFQCHGTNGAGGFEKLAGKSANELYGELKKFSTGAEDANGIMAAHAMGFSDTQLNAIAAYFASLR